MAADVAKMKSAQTVEGSDLKIDARKGIKVNDASVPKVNVEADNGVIHVIDRVLIPARKFQVR